LWEAGIARKEARTADAVQEFTEDIFYTNSRSNPDPVKAQQTTARQLLDIGARKASASLQDAPEAKLRMLKMLGSLYQSLGVDDQAVSLEKDRLAAAEKLYGRESPELVRILLDLASCMHASRSVNERETVLLRAKAIVDKQHDFNSETRGRLLVGLAQHYTSSDLEKATRFAGESITVLRQYPLSGSYVSALYVAGLAYERSGEFAKSVSALDEAIAVSKRIDGDPNESLPRFYAHSAGAHEELGQYDSAERGYTLAYEYARKLGGDTDIDTLETESRLGSYLIDTSRFEQGLRLLQKATTDCLRVQGPDDPFYTPQMQLQLGMALEARDRPEEALREISAAVKNRQEHRPGTVYLAQMMEDEALVLIELGRLPEAERELSSAEQIRRKVNSKLTANFAIPRVQLELVRHHTGEALSLVERYYGPVNAEGQRSHDAMRNLLFRAEIAAQNRDGRSVASLMKQLQARLAAEQHVKYLRTWLAKSLFYEGVGRIQQGDFQGAVPVLQKAVDERTALLDRNSPELAITEAMLGQAYFGCRDFGHARSLLASAQSRLSAHKELNDTYKEPVRALGGYLSRISSTKKT
jgi:serine/threonine-protein kinase